MTYEDIYSCADDGATDAVDDAGEASGLVIKWRRRGVRWEGLVSHEVDGKIITEWIPALTLAPEEPDQGPPAAN